MGLAQRKAEEARSPLWAPLIGSLAVHALMLSSASLFMSQPTSVSTPTRVMRVRFPNPPSAVAPQQDRKSILDSTGQVVDLLEKQSSENAPDSARYLSDRNRSVEKEMQARQTGPNPTASKGESGPQGQQGKSKPSEQGTFGKGKVDLSLPSKFLSGNENPGTGNVASLAPSNYLPEIEMGDETLLNTREYIYASYFIRMKRQMEGVWNPRGILMSRKSVQKQYVTAVNIILKRDGRVEAVKLVQSSGDPALDQEALRAAHSAGPYLNPPNGLIERDGRIRIPEWNFIVTLNSLF